MQDAPHPQHNIMGSNEPNLTILTESTAAPLSASSSSYKITSSKKLQLGVSSRALTHHLGDHQLASEMASSDSPCTYLTGEPHTASTMASFSWGGEEPVTQCSCMLPTQEHGNKKLLMVPFFQFSSDETNAPFSLTSLPSLYPCQQWVSGHGTPYPCTPPLPYLVTCSPAEC